MYWKTVTSSFGYKFKCKVLNFAGIRNSVN